MVISNGCYLDFYNISVNLSSTNYILNGMGATQDGQLKSTLQADGTTTGTAGSFTINGTVTLNATSDIGGTSPAQTMTLAGTVTGPGGLVKNGSSGTLVLANTNTYAGGTTVSSGLVKAQVAGSLGSGGVVVANGAMLELDNPAAMSSSASLFVLGFEMLSVQASVEDMWQEAPAKLLKLLAKHGVRPASLTVERPWLGSVLKQLCAGLQIELRSGPLTTLPEIRQDMERMLQR